jgi:serine/threonine-protein kinase HipA
MGESAVRVGHLDFEMQGQRELLSVHYHSDWLDSGFAISPDLPLVEGYASFTRKSGEVAGFPFALLDAEPDGWGRRVIRRLARKEKEPTPRTSLDFLLSVDDTTRIGALRFLENGQFLKITSPHAAPRLLDLEKIAGALRAVESGRGTASEIQFLSGLGTSLGGVRPKCSLRDTDGTLMIGKFSGLGDERDVVRGEMLALKLAQMAGLNAAEAKICRVGKTAALAIKRFDRTPDGRTHYLSAGSVLRLDRQDDFSYLQLANQAVSLSPEPTGDRLECWKRMMFNFLICNVDDHSRNHGFLYAGSGKWRLAPAFDVNPFPDKDRSLKAHLFDDGTLMDDLAAGFAASSIFGIDNDQAKQALGQMAQALLDWRKVAKSKAVGMADRDVREYEAAFDVELLRQALSLSENNTAQPSTSNSGVGKIRR